MEIAENIRHYILAGIWDKIIESKSIANMPI